MSWIEAHGNPQSGMLPLQHKNFAQEQFDLDYRAFKGAVRIIKRPLIRGIPTGHWQIDPDTAGDIIGGQVWLPDFNKRPIAAWRFAWPVTLVPSSGGGTATQSAGGGECAIAGSSAMLPMWQTGYQADGRFNPITIGRPTYGSGEFLWPKFPVGWKGVSLTADNEETQIEYFLPNDPRLIAAHKDGDPEMGTNVVDMGPGFAPDPFRHSRLHTIVRVIKGPESDFVDYHKRNSLALNFTDSGCADVRGGLWVDRPFGAGTGEDKKRIVAAFSDFDHGPMLGGTEGDKHKLGKDRDGNEICSGHIALLTNFFHNKEEDAPLKYDGVFTYIRGPKPGSHTPGTHFTDVWFEYDPKESHAHLSGQKLGRFKWRASTMVYEPTGVPPPEPTPTPTPGTKTPGGDKPPDGGSPGGGPPIGPSTPTPGHSTTSGGGPIPPIPEIGFTQLPGIPVPTPTPIPLPRIDRMSPARASGMERRTFAATTLDFSAPAIMGRPQFVNSDRWFDLRTAMAGLTPHAAFRHDIETPVVGRLEWIGEQIGDRFTYTQRPQRGNLGRWIGGTADGGVWLLPPEVDMADEATNFAPRGVTLSTVYLGALRTNCYFAAGLPRPENGAVESGYRWGADADGNLQFDSLDSSGVVTSRIRFDTAGGIGFINSGFIANIAAPTLTVDRTWRTVDRDGTVQLNDIVGGLFTAGSVAFANADGILAQDNANFFWDDTNKRLGIGITPTQRLHVRQDQNAQTAMFVENQTDGTGAAAEFRSTQSSEANEVTCQFISFSPSHGSRPGHAFLAASGSGLTKFRVAALTAVPLTLETDSLERVHVTGAGLVGIGLTPDTNVKLHVGAGTFGSVNAKIGSGQVAGSRDTLVLDADAPRLYFQTPSTKRNWKISAQDTVDQSLEIMAASANSATAISDTYNAIISLQGPNRNVGLNGVSYGGGSGVLFVANAATVPTASPTAGHLVYSEAGALKGRGSGGTITTIAAAEPHCSRCGKDFAWEWENPKFGKLSACAWCLMEKLDPTGTLFTIECKQPWIKKRGG